MLIRVDMPDIPNARNRATWPFPTAGLVSYDPVGNTAIFDVPDADGPAAPPPTGDQKRPNTPVGAVLIDGSTVNNVLWLNTLKGRYPTAGIVAVPQVK